MDSYGAAKAHKSWEIDVYAIENHETGRFRKFNMSLHTSEKLCVASHNLVSS